VFITTVMRALKGANVSTDPTAITSIETYALAVPLPRPIADSTAAMAHWTVPVVEIRTADGRVGTGISGVHCAPELLCNVIDNYYAAALIDTSAADISGTWKRLYWLPTHWIGRAGAVHMALAMVDIPGRAAGRRPAVAAARRHGRSHRGIQHRRRLAELQRG
jgi:L-alanine-DL-glutamate epimerase-like enolase superfamily enzyme